jgi:hypothetical protein
MQSGPSCSRADIALFYSWGRLSMLSHSSHRHLFGLAALDLGARGPMPTCTYMSLQAYIKSMDSNNNETHKHCMTTTYYPLLWARVALTSWPRKLLSGTVPDRRVGCCQGPEGNGVNPGEEGEVGPGPPSRDKE